MPINSANSHITIAVASDLHAHSEGGDNGPSHLCTSTPEDSRHPISSLIELIRIHDLSADVLLCPGDLADKANPAALTYAWQAIHKIKKALHAPDLIATAGNHDVDSRYQYNNYDAKGFLQTLSPRFPVDTESHCDKFWSRHFAVIVRKSYRLVVLNSSAFHGTAELEYEHGRISLHTIAALELALDATDSRELNVLLCHHHPHQHAEIGLGEKDLMRGGQQLLDLLASGKHGDWIVIHGHKHHPKISYAGGATGGTPIVFAAGSLCANLFLALQTEARNQFHLLTFPINHFKEYGLVGRFRTWEWTVGKGWIPARGGGGLPRDGGFGCRHPVRVLANQVASLFRTPRVTWEEVRNVFPHVDYLLPQDHSNLLVQLDKNHRVRPLMESDGTIVELEMIS